MTQDAPYMTVEKEHKQTKGKKLLHQWKNDDQQWEFFLLSPKKILGAIMMAMQNIVVNSPHWKKSWLLIPSWFSFTISWNGVNRKHLFLYPQDKKPDMSVKS